MPRFFVPPSALAGDLVTLEGEQAAHAKALRLAPGEEVTLCDGAGTDYRCTVSSLQSGRLTLAVRQSMPSCTEPTLRVSLYLGFPKADKLEHVIQKATELGAFEIVAFPCARSVSRPDGKSLAKKLERWQKIAASAAEQSGRGRIPQVLALDSFDQAVCRAAQADWSALFYENERQCSLRRAWEGRAIRSAAIFTGPEGGLTETEVAQARAAGMAVCTLGPRILRCETAPLCALSALMYAADELA